LSILELQLQQLSQASPEPLHEESPQLLETMTSILASETVDTTTTGRTSGCRTTRGKDISSYSSLIPKSRDKTTSSTPFLDALKILDPQEWKRNCELYTNSGIMIIIILIDNYNSLLI